MNGRAIVTFSRSWYTVSAIRSLGRRGIDVIAADEFAVTPGGLSRYASEQLRYPSPDRDPAGFLDALDRAVDEHAPPDGVPYALLPMHRESYLIAEHRDRFESRIGLALPEISAIDRVRNKRRLVRLARELGVATPQTWLPESLDDARKAADETSYPAFVKVPAGAGGIGIERCADGDELVEAWERIVREHGLSGDALPLVQAFVPGQDYCVSALYDRGQQVALLTYRNTANFPEDGPGAIRQSASAPRLEAQVDRLLSTLGWHGIAQADFRWTGDPDDEGALIEINPRCFSGLSHAVAAGVDYPVMLFQLATLGRVEEEPHPVEGIRTEAPVTGLLATLSEIADESDTVESLEEAWRTSQAALRGDVRWKDAIAGIRAALTGSLDVSRRVDRVRQVLEENRDNVGMLMESEDPMPVLGLVYPLVAFLQRGELSEDVFTGASIDQGGEQEDDG